MKLPTAGPGDLLNMSKHEQQESLDVLIFT